MTIYCHVHLADSDKESLLNALSPTDQCFFAQDLSPAEQQVRCGEAEVIFGNVPTDWLTDNANLRWLQLNSAGLNPYNRFDWSQLPEVTVTNLHGFFGQSCAETALAGILALYRGIAPLVDYQRDHEWVGSKLRPSLHVLSGKRALVLGAGAIGQTTGRLLEAFGCAVTYVRRTEAPTFADLDALLPKADLVVGTLPETAETINMLDATRLGLMKRGSVLVNVGRGSLLDERALIDLLTHGYLAGAVLDVTAVEPLPADHPLWDLPNVILTQHTSGGYADEKRDMVGVFINNLHAYKSGQPLANEVDFSRGY
ncbi:D-2-hydroxyacid dehydrogenase [Fibrella sp. WM1]|uniref:D-2-hydroxyacid dehydrogenase n=1 Tax=Fibrella musci TaxID=3242485 RepID=UPI00351F9006